MVGNDSETQPWTYSLLSQLHSLGFTGHQQKNSEKCNANQALKTEDCFVKFQ
jgi:hypothetical protein